MRAAVATALLLTAALLAEPAGAPQPGRPATAKHGMVSSAHPLATEAGLEILRAGGNAFDAAVAVAAALNVVESGMSGMGGYGTIVLYDAPSKETWFLNPSGRIPAAVDADAFRPPTPGYLENRRGAKSVSTPGNVHAWEAMSTKYGRLRWERLLQPAIRLAEEGFALGQRDADMIGRMFDGFPAHAKEIFGREDRPLGRGENPR
jgi:gamma-glutamyltranspeptidase/glutathione hydrolase